MTRWVEPHYAALAVKILPRHLDFLKLLEDMAMTEKKRHSSRALDPNERAFALSVLRLIKQEVAKNPTEAVNINIRYAVRWFRMKQFAMGVRHAKRVGVNMDEVVALGALTGAYKPNSEEASPNG